MTSFNYGSFHAKMDTKRHYVFIFSLNFWYLTFTINRAVNFFAYKDFFAIFRTLLMNMDLADECFSECMCNLWEVAFWLRNVILE